VTSFGKDGEIADQLINQKLCAKINRKRIFMKKILLFPKEYVHWLNIFRVQSNKSFPNLILMCVNLIHTNLTNNNRIGLLPAKPDLNYRFNQ